MDFPIEELLRLHNITKAHLIRKTGIGRSTINNIIKGDENFNITTIKRLADALNVDVVITIVAKHTR